MAWTDYSANILTNPGGEAGSLTGWTAAGGGTFGAFTDAQMTTNATVHEFYGDAPRGRTGSYAFACGYGGSPSTNTSSRIYQDIDLSALVDTADIDAGRMRVQAGGWMKVLEYNYDSVKLVIQVLNSGGTVIATPLNTGYIGPLGSNGSFVNYEILDSVIPTNGRTLRISFYAYESGGYSGGVGDDFYVYWSEDEAGGRTTYNTDSHPLGIGVGISRRISGI